MTYYIITRKDFKEIDKEEIYKLIPDALFSSYGHITEEIEGGLIVSIDDEETKSDFDGNIEKHVNKIRDDWAIL